MCKIFASKGSVSPITTLVDLLSSMKEMIAEKLTAVTVNDLVRLVVYAIVILVAQAAVVWAMAMLSH